MDLDLAASQKKIIEKKKNEIKTKRDTRSLSLVRTKKRSSFKQEQNRHNSYQCSCTVMMTSPSYSMLPHDVVTWWWRHTVTVQFRCRFCPTLSNTNEILVCLNTHTHTRELCSDVSNATSATRRRSTRRGAAVVIRARSWERRGRLRAPDWECARTWVARRDAE